MLSLPSVSHANFAKGLEEVLEEIITPSYQQPARRNEEHRLLEMKDLVIFCCYEADRRMKKFVKWR